ncbi:MAG: TlpA disulfide reductase family protein [Bacteroidales bacterium]|nr:TlpA disulfide reductase family protein [Bacteroidales bacterium]
MNQFYKLFYAIFIVLLAVIAGLPGMTQEADEINRLELTFAGYEQDRLLWASLYGDDIVVVDTIYRTQQNRFSYTVPYGTPYGIYRLLTPDGEKHIDVVYDGENIFLSTHYQAVLDELVIKSSQATRQYHRFMRIRAYIRYKQKILDDFLASYPPGDPFYRQADQQYVSLSEEMNDSIDAIAAKDTFLGRLLQYEKMVYADSIEGRKQYTEFRKAHFFDAKDYTDGTILRSNLLPEQILDYLSLYREEHYNKRQQEAAFLEAIDSVMKHTKAHPEVFDFVINYLIEGFKRFGFDDLVQHIAERTAAEINCINEERRQDVEEQISRIRAVAVGSQAPPLTMPDINGDSVRLYDVDSRYVLLVFWASWCPHCMAMLPELHDFTRSHKDSLKTVAVSLDREAQEWKAAADKYPWIHLSALQGWETPAVEDYYVYGTPSFFLLDNKKVILEKGATLREIRSFLKD